MLLILLGHRVPLSDVELRYTVANFIEIDRHYSTSHSINNNLSQMNPKSASKSVTLNVTKTNDPHAIFQRQRKPETLQNYWQKRLRWWLDLANLLPFTHMEQELFAPLEKLPPEERATLRDAFIERFDTRPKAFRPEALSNAESLRIRTETGPLHPLIGLAGRLADSIALLEKAQNVHEASSDKVTRLKRVLEVYEGRLLDTFSMVRLLLEQLTAPIDATEENGFSFPIAIRLPVLFEVGDYADTGHLSFLLDPITDALKNAFERVEIARIRRCPMCGKFFYAVRANKGACDEHLAYARVQRGRDPEMRKQYEENRRINRLVREGKSLAQAKEEVAKKRRKRRTDK